MDLATLQQLIGSLGFPIVVTGFLLIKGTKIIGDLKEALENNTVVLQKLLTERQVKEGGQQ